MVHVLMYRSRPIIPDKISVGVQLCVAQYTTDYNMFLGHSINVWIQSSYVKFENTVFTELAGYLSTVIVVRATQVVLYISGYMWLGSVGILL